MKLGIINPAEAIAIKTSTYNLTAVDSGNVYTNEGATSAVNFYLPTPIVGLVYTFMVQDADGIFINADATSTIVMGTISTTSLSSNNPGDAIVLTAISTTKWIATKKIGTFQGPGVGNAYFGGGYVSASPVATIDKLTGDTFCASITATLSIARWSLASAKIASSAYYAGGYQGPTNRIDKLISDSSCSSVSATLSQSTYGLSSGATLSSSAYFALASGRIDKLTNDTTCASVTATWTLPRYNAAAGVLSSSVYFCPGSDSDLTTPINRFDKLTNDTTCTSVSATLSTNRGVAGGATLNSAIYLAGGFGVSNVIDKLTNDTTCAAVTATLTQSRSYPCGVTISSSAYFGGGWTGAVSVNRIDKLVSDSSCASVAATLSTIRHVFAGLTINF